MAAPRRDAPQLPTVEEPEEQPRQQQPRQRPRPSQIPVRQVRREEYGRTDEGPVRFVCEFSPTYINLA